MKALNYATRDVLTVAPADSIDRAINLMEERDVHHLVVVQDDRPVGILSDRDILISTGWMLGVERRVQGSRGRVATVGPTRVEQIMTRPVVMLPESGTAREAAALMLNRKIGAVPVLQGERLAGIVTETDLLRWLEELALGDTAAQRLLARDVRQLMPPRIISVAPEVPLEEVVDIFRRFRVRHVPVTGRGRVLLGIISDRDVRRVLAWASVRDMQADAAGRVARETPPETAAEIMHTEIRTVSPAAPLRQAVRSMLEHRIHSLPVVEADSILGVITATDFTRAIAREDLL